MTPKEIEEKIEEIKKHERRLGDLSNFLWEEKDRLRNLYKKLTGEEI